MKPVRIGIVGVGKIARDHHIPSIAANSAFQLVGVVSRHAQLPGTPNFSSLEDMLTALPELDAIAICTPPQAHYEAAALALAGGKHVLLEKPPCCSIAQLEELVRAATSARRTLYAAWHSQHASGVAAAQRLLRQRVLQRVQVSWMEDVRQWHPGQRWLREPGGFGVFDAGINALSVLTRLIPDPIFARSARLSVPGNWAAPIAAEIELETSNGVPISAALDYRYAGAPKWEIVFSTDLGTATLSGGGATLTLDECTEGHSRVDLAPEYAAIYRHLDELIRRGLSDVDARPLQCVADVFLVARHILVEPFAVSDDVDTVAT
jgi:D-galactose 1-dehydrogenase